MISRRAGILTRNPAVGGSHVVSRNEIAAAAGSQRHWIEIVVGLAVRIGGPGGKAFVDGELSTGIGDDVVVQS